MERDSDSTDNDTMPEVDRRPSFLGEDGFSYTTFFLFLFFSRPVSFFHSPFYPLPVLNPHYRRYPELSGTLRKRSDWLKRWHDRYVIIKAHRFCSLSLIFLFVCAVCFHSSFNLYKQAFYRQKRTYTST